MASEPVGQRERVDRHHDRAGDGLVAGEGHGRVARADQGGGGIERPAALQAEGIDRELEAVGRGGLVGALVAEQHFKVEPFC